MKRWLVAVAVASVAAGCGGGGSITGDWAYRVSADGLTDRRGTLDPERRGWHARLDLAGPPATGGVGAGLESIGSARSGSPPLLRIRRSVLLASIAVRRVPVVVPRGGSAGKHRLSGHEHGQRRSDDRLRSLATARTRRRGRGP